MFDLQIDDYESSINATDIDYDSRDAIFSGWIYVLNTLQLNFVKRSFHSKGTNYREKIVKYHGQNCCTPTSGKCFINCNKTITDEDYEEDFRDFIIYGKD